MCDQDSSRLYTSFAKYLNRLSNTRSLFDALPFRRLSEDHEQSPCLKRPRAMWGNQRRNLALDAMMMCWGLGTWLGVNGLYVQLPLLVEVLPEGWGLPASMTVAIQLANVGLVTYVLVRRLFPKASDAPYIYSLLCIGIVALTLNAFVYERTAYVGSTERSVAFLSLTFFAALVGCTSSVLFYPYLRHFRDVYLSTYLVGEGLSGFVPSILALIQGVSGEPECVPGEDGSVWPVRPPARFSSSVFFVLLGVLSAVSLTGFAVVDRCKAFDSERVAEKEADKEEEATTTNVSLSSSRWIVVMVLMAVLNALNNGVMPSVQSYSCMPYGTMTYHLAVTLSAMANPMACLAGVWLKPVPAVVLGGMLAFMTLPFSYIMTTALMSPAPPLLGETGGSVLVVLAWVLTAALVSYARMWIYGWAREGGAKGMRACGISTQIGSALGSLLLFVLVNYADIFVQADDCPATL